MATGDAALGLRLAGGCPIRRVALHSSEQLRQSGFGAVRGFREDQRFVDRGMLFRHEIRLSPFGNPQDAFGSLSPYVLLDHAQGALVGGPLQRLSSIGAGLRWAGARGSSELVVAKPIDCPPELGSKQTRLHFTLTLPL